MTSANIIEYRILNKKNIQVGNHRQNIMCKRNNDGLEKFQPSEDFTIQMFGYDEEEEYWEDKKQVNLSDWLKNNKAAITLKTFEIGDEVKVIRTVLTKKSAYGVITKILPRKFISCKIKDLSKVPLYLFQIIPQLYTDLHGVPIVEEVMEFMMQKVLKKCNFTISETRF